MPYLPSLVRLCKKGHERTRVVPGVCIESGQLRTWIPVSICRSGIRAAANSDCSDELCANEYVMINY